MKLVEVQSKKEQRQYLSFRRALYGSHLNFVDNNLYLIQELFAGKTSFTKNKEVRALWVEDEGKILCEGMIIYAPLLKEYIQVGFFESLEHAEAATQMFLDHVSELGKEKNCERMVIGLNGHVNYGLGLLASSYEKKNSFSASFNPAYYHPYFTQYGCQSIPMNTYRINQIDGRLDRYAAFFRKIDRSYTFRVFDKKRFDEDAKIYTDLNNLCFNHHPYYYERNYQEDKEMLQELFLFMKPDSLIYAFYEDKPVAFLLWYPDFNELAKPGETFGVKHYFRNLVGGRKIQTAKVMEYGVLEEYRKVGLPLALIHQVFLALQNYNITRVETSWIMEENRDSASFCQGICDEVNTKYVIYEKEL